MFISFEGIDGSGKSTQARLLAQALRDAGRDVILTREPGGSPGAEEIRRLVLEGSGDRWSAETELLLFTAARRDHCEKTIRPALAAGGVVICDRFVDSTRVFQGLTRGDLRDKVNQLHDMMIGLNPDLTVLIDMDPAEGLARATARQGQEMRFEEMGLQFHQKVRDGFLELSKTHADRFCIINGAQSIERVTQDVMTAVMAAQPTITEPRP